MPESPKSYTGMDVPSVPRRSVPGTDFGQLKRSAEHNLITLTGRNARAALAAEQARRAKEQEKQNRRFYMGALREWRQALKTEIRYEPDPKRQTALREELERTKKLIKEGY
jgi:hypothetical protein